MIVIKKRKQIAFPLCSLSANLQKSAASLNCALMSVGIEQTSGLILLKSKETDYKT